MPEARPMDLQGDTSRFFALHQHAPFRQWPLDLQNSWYQDVLPNDVRDLRFLHAIALLLCMGCLILDIAADVFRIGVVLRFGLVAPAYVLGIWLLGSKHAWRRLAAAIVPISLFGGSLAYIGMQADVDVADRYVMAASMLMTVYILLFPLRTVATSLLALSGFVAIAVPVLTLSHPTGSNADLVVFAFLCCTAPLLIKRRSDRLRDTNFLLMTINRRAQNELLANNRKLEELSKLDPLTGLLNRRGFECSYAVAYEAAQTSGEPFAVLLMDLDHFKRFNDTHGHQLGDECLMQVGSLLQQEIHHREGICGRYGGEEFIAALCGFDSAQVIGIGTQILSKVAGLNIRDQFGRKACITASMGAQVTSAADLDRQRFIYEADQALYAAKADGRDRLVLHPSGGAHAREGPGACSRSNGTGRERTGIGRPERPTLQYLSKDDAGPLRK